MAMGDVKSIEQAVEALQPSELAELRHWFAQVRFGSVGQAD
jgi:hypothetical protein